MLTQRAYDGGEGNRPERLMFEHMQACERCREARYPVCRAGKDMEYDAGLVGPKKGGEPVVERRQATRTPGRSLRR